MRLRLYHHPDGARVAYREAGTGPPLGLLHSAGLSHREWEPVVDGLADRFRVVLPDLPLHGDSEDRPRHPYTPDWLAEVIAGFCRETLGPRPLVGGHELGAEILLRAWSAGTRAAAVPGLDRAMAHGAKLVVRRALGDRLAARANPAARDLLRHAFADVGGNGNLARSWSRFARRWPLEPQRDLLDAYHRIDIPVLLLWADEDRLHPLVTAEEALDLLPNAQLRVLSGTGFLMAYDDGVGVARELAAFCG